MPASLRFPPPPLFMLILDRRRVNCKVWGEEELVQVEAKPAAVAGEVVSRESTKELASDSGSSSLQPLISLLKIT